MEVSCQLWPFYHWVGGWWVRETEEFLAPPLGFIALMMETVSTSETSADIYQTTLRSTPEDGHL
jgi:hypothetical protein